MPPDRVNDTLGGQLRLSVDDQNRFVGLKDLNKLKSEMQSIARTLDPSGNEAGMPGFVLGCRR